MKLLTEDETAESLSCTKAALRRWRRERRGPRFVKLGRLVRYRESDLTDFVDQHTEGVSQQRKRISQIGA